jgi:hypothetical protein
MLVGFSHLTRSERDDQLPFSGTLRCNSSMKFSRKITWPASCCVEPPAEVAIARRLPSGATSYWAPTEPLSVRATLCPDQTRAFPATKASPLT